MTYFKLKFVGTMLLITSYIFSVTVFAAEEQPDEKKNELKFYTAAKEGRLPQIKAMLSEGMNVNSKNSAGRTALMSAAYNGNRKIVKTLVVEGADVNQVDAQGKTALMMAVANVRLDIVEELLRAGADVKLEDKNKKTAITMAEKIQNKELTKLLESASE